MRSSRSEPEPFAGSPRLTELGSVVSHAQTESRVQLLTERFHREGLPVARLWENHAALVSLGLNSRGKPGLWLVQKTH